MSQEMHGETAEAKALREENTKRMEAQLLAKVAEHTVPPSPDLCDCGHGRAMHFDEDGDHNGPCLWQVHPDAPFCKCDMWHRKPSGDEFLGVPVSDWRQIAAEINCRRGPDGPLLKRFREMLEVSDMRAAMLKNLTPRAGGKVDVRRLLEDFTGGLNNPTSTFDDAHIKSMTAALRAQGIETEDHDAQ